MDGISQIIAESAKASREAIEAIDQLIRLPKKARTAYTEFQLDSAISKINERLYGRYELIHAVRNFGQLKGPEEDFKAIIATARERARYLESFNKKIESKLKKISPKLASDLVIMTRSSIELYRQLAEINDPGRMAALAPTLANVLSEIASYLENVNIKLKEMVARD